MVKVENEKKVKKRKQEDDSDYEEREVNMPLCLELCTKLFGFGLLLKSYLTDPGKETKEENQSGKERHHWGEKESQK